MSTKDSAQIKVRAMFKRWLLSWDNNIFYLLITKLACFKYRKGLLIKKFNWLPSKNDEDNVLKDEKSTVTLPDQKSWEEQNKWNQTDTSRVAYIHTQLFLWQTAGCFTAGAFGAIFPPLWFWVCSLHLYEIMRCKFPSLLSFSFFFGGLCLPPLVMWVRKLGFQRSMGIWRRLATLMVTRRLISFLSPMEVSYNL